MRAFRLLGLLSVALGLVLTLPPPASPAATPSKTDRSGTDKSDSLATLKRRVNELQRAGSYREAGRAAEQVATAERARYGDKHPRYGAAIHKQGQIHTTERRYADAEPLLRRALEIYEGVYGPDNRTVASALVSLGALLRRTHRLPEAEAVLRRSVQILEKKPEGNDARLANTLNTLAIVMRQRGNPGESESLYRRSLALAEKARGPEHTTVARRLGNLAVLLMNQRPAEAEPLLRRALAIMEKAHGPDHPAVAIKLNTMANLMRLTGRSAEAEQLLRRALSIDEKAFGSRHANVGTALMNLALLHARRGDWAGAAQLGRRAMSSLTGHGQERGAKERDPVGSGGNTEKDNSGEDADDPESVPDSRVLADRSNAFRAHTRALYHSAPDDERVRGEALEVAQWAGQSGAADALAQMSLRFAKEAGALGALIRERQDLLVRRQTDDNRLLAAIGRNDAVVSGQLRNSLAALDAQIDGIDERLARDFKEYAVLSRPVPLNIAEIQALLQADEALMQFLDTPEESLVFIVTKDSSRWFTSKLGTQSLGQTIAALRCGLDASQWSGGDDEDKCVKLLNSHAFDELIDGQIATVLPFDLQRAHILYKELFSPAEDMIAGKHLLIVPSGPLAGLPFSVLVTEQPKTHIPRSIAEYRGVAWLGTHQPITVLPSVTSLKALRQFAKTSQAKKSYLGIGNPLLNGLQNDRQWGEYYKKQAQAARDKRCSEGPAVLQVAAARTPRRIRGSEDFFDGDRDHAIIEQLRVLIPLPETGDELCEIGRRLGVPHSEILLGGQATETSLKDLSKKGSLPDYAIVHFATHGALAGQVQGLREPGLVLTPPASGTTDSQALEHDDGFLTASEIAALRLDAQWVILSACNTAGAAEGTAEPLSGLARAFFYAGARALLVSHWAVVSHAAVRLTTQAFTQLQSDPGIGRAEAVRRSMSDIVNDRNPADAHPSVWAPFVVVGEGSH